MGNVREVAGLLCLLLVAMSAAISATSVRGVCPGAAVDPHEAAVLVEVSHAALRPAAPKLTSACSTTPRLPAGSRHLRSPGGRAPARTPEGLQRGGECVA